MLHTYQTKLGENSIAKDIKQLELSNIAWDLHDHFGKGSQPLPKLPKLSMRLPRDE